MNERTGSLSGEQVSHLVGLIYDCVLMPDRWTATVEAIRAEFGFANGALSSMYAPTGEHLIGAVTGISPYWVSRMGEFGEALVELWGGPARIAQYPLEEPLVVRQATDPALLARNRYIREWALPQGIDDAVAIQLERDKVMVANIAFGQHSAAGPISDRTTEALRLLAPHLRRAVNISRILEVKTIEASSFAAAFDAHKAGVAMVDANMRLLYANSSAEVMLAAADPIQVRQGRLGVGDRAAERALETAVTSCASDEALLSRRSGMGIAIHGKQNISCIVHVLPLRQRSALLNVANQAVVALFITRSSDAPASLPSQVMDTLYGLTPAETRVFELIVEGKTKAQAAKLLGVAATTLNTHLVRVFQKTGMRRQSDLVRLARSLAAPL